MDADVIVVGGRPAGASLAARLGAAGLRTLVLERAELPSAPFVPSCPTLHMGTMKLLDELGLSESAYGPDALRFDGFAIEFGRWFRARIAIPTVHGRAYGYSILRPRFDLALWQHLERFPSVTRRRFTVGEVLRDPDGAVIGVEGHAPDGPPEHLHARWVVGADGRFSGVARSLGVGIVEESAERVSTVHFADWEGVQPLDPAYPQDVNVHTTGRGLNVLFFPLPEGRVTVCLHARADRVQLDGDADAYYRRTLDSVPAVAARLVGATQATRLLGLKRVGNGYRPPGGAGWMLVGDAFHFKDPVDGQGIYDALLGTRVAAEEIGASLRGEKSLAAAAASYGQRTRAGTHDMFLATCKRLETELYAEPPVAVIRTLLRWMLQDPGYQDRFIRFLGRELDPATWLSPRVVVGAVLRGIGRDLARPFQASTPTALPPSAVTKP